MKVLVCGSRQWADQVAVISRLRALPAGTIMLTGAARGADSIAAVIGRGLSLEVIEFPAKWNKLGRSAGYMRNLVMLDQCPDLVIAFHLNNSPGTAHMIKSARERGIPVEVIVSDVS